MESQEGASPGPDLPSTNEVNGDTEHQVEAPDGNATNELQAVDAPSNPPSPETTPAQPKMCGVCKTEESKYKCSACYLPYCSIPCLKIHKVDHPVNKTPSSSAANKEESPVSKANPRPGTVAAAGYKGPFAALDDSKELKLLFEKYPSLSAQLDIINTATLPPAAGDTGFDQRDQRKNGKSEPWTTDRGLQKGVEAMNRARADGSENGEAVREYYKLVLRILSGEGTVDAAEVIQKEIEEENVRIISELLERENG